MKHRHVGILIDSSLPEIYDNVSRYLDNAKIHLDDYPGQEELRKEYFENNFKLEYQKDKKTIIRVPDILKRIGKWLIKEPYDQIMPVPNVIDELVNYERYLEQDQIFTNRWMKRS